MQTRKTMDALRARQDPVIAFQLMEALKATQTSQEIPAESTEVVAVVKPEAREDSYQKSLTVRANSTNRWSDQFRSKPFDEGPRTPTASEVRADYALADDDQDIYRELTYRTSELAGLNSVDALYFFDTVSDHVSPQNAFAAYLQSEGINMHEVHSEQIGDLESEINPIEKIFDDAAFDGEFLFEGQVTGIVTRDQRTTPKRDLTVFPTDEEDALMACFEQGEKSVYLPSSTSNNTSKIEFTREDQIMRNFN